MLTHPDFGENIVSYQIINTVLTPGEDEHWIMFKLNPDEGKVSVYDSAQAFTHCRLRHDVT